MVGIELQPSAGAQTQQAIVAFEREQDAEYALEDLDGFQGLWIRQVTGLLAVPDTTLAPSFMLCRVFIRHAARCCSKSGLIVYGAPCRIASCSFRPATQNCP